MRKFKVTHPNGKDYFIVKGETMKDCQEKASITLEKLGWKIYKCKAEEIEINHEKNHT